MRTFIAVNLLPEERRAAYDAAAPLRAAHLPVRWAAADALHVTLRFLGEVDEERAAAIGTALAGVVRTARPFEVALGGVGAFPSLARPRVVWLGVQAHPALELLAHDVERVLSAFGFEAELRPFHPHLTLGRVKHGARPGSFRDLERLAEGIAYQGTTTVTSVDLMRSVLDAHGASYSVLSRAVLAGGAGS
jgi:2'-5' RNA ligase